MSQTSSLPSLGEPADEKAWRALVDAGLKGASWDKLTRKTADGIEIAPLYRESDVATAADEAGFPGAAPFVRGDNARNMDDVTGFGLGLSIARAIVLAHGGGLSLHDRQPHGLTVRIELPLRQQDLQSAA